MLGGLLSSAFLTLEVLPVLYTIWRYRQLRRAQRMDVTIEVALGVARAQTTVPARGEGQLHLSLPSQRSTSQLR